MIDMTFLEIVFGQIMYIRLAIIGSPIGVDTEKGYERFSRLTSKFILYKELQRKE